MNNWPSNLFLTVIAGVMLFCVANWPGRQASSQPAPVIVPVIQPQPPRRPLLPREDVAGASVGGPMAPDGTQINCDLPGSLHQRNTGGSDGAGLCVYASARHAGRWQNDPLFEAVFEWMRRHPGGSYPEKFDRTLRQCAKELGLPVPEYVQVTNSRDLDVLRLACQTGRMPGVTYERSPTRRYGGGRIAHMVSLPHADERWFCVLDNNYPGADKYEWMSPDEFLRVCNPGGYWAVILLSPPPPGPPTN